MHVAPAGGLETPKEGLVAPRTRGSRPGLFTVAPPGLEHSVRVPSIHNPVAQRRGQLLLRNLLVRNELWV